MVDVSAATQNIPPQVMQALQQQSQGMSGGDITGILAQLAEMSPDELANALQQLGIQVQPDQLVSAAENWLDSAADKQASGGSDDETTETTPDSETAEGEAPQAAQAQASDEEGGDTEGQMQNEEAPEQAALPPNAQPTSYSPQTQMAGTPPAPMAAQQGAAPMPVSGGGRLPPSAAMRGAAMGGGATMDDLISAAMMQQAAGNPNAAVPMPRPKGARMPGAPTSLGNTRTQNPANTRSKKRG